MSTFKHLSKLWIIVVACAVGHAIPSSDIANLEKHIRGETVIRGKS